MIIDSSWKILFIPGAGGKWRLYTWMMVPSACVCHRQTPKRMKKKIKKNNIITDLDQNAVKCVITKNTLMIFNAYRNGRNHVLHTPIVGNFSALYVQNKTENLTRGKHFPRVIQSRKLITRKHWKIVCSKFEFIFVSARNQNQ